MFTRDASLLLVVDIQEKLWAHIANREQVRDRTSVVIRGARELGVPMLVSEQYPQGLGPTVKALEDLMAPGTVAYAKTAFSCLGDQGLTDAIAGSGRRQLVVCGIEAHICVLQTVFEVLRDGYQAAVVADAVGSRKEADRQAGLERMRARGAEIVSSEMILFEWLRDASHPAFKVVSQLVK